LQNHLLIPASREVFLNLLPVLSHPGQAARERMHDRQQVFNHFLFWRQRFLIDHDDLAVGGGVKATLDGGARLE
jgi:hypothetical protein